MRAGHPECATPVDRGWGQGNPSGQVRGVGPAGTSPALNRCDLSLIQCYQSNLFTMPHVVHQ